MDELRNCESEVDLKTFLADQARVHLQQFVDGGRADGLPFDEIYSNLRALRGDRGLSNSEVALAAGLWSAADGGCEIDHVSLSDHFPATGVSRRLDELKERLRAADGILLSGPVYFGDRGSLAQDLIDLIRNDETLRADLQDKVYAGIAVGAKRNGGQETTLVYQLMDMIRLGLLGVGNDSDTTSQYGGTGMAGDVGTMAKDDYGLSTAMGTGRRIAQVTQLMEMGAVEPRHGGPVRILFWVLQDCDRRAAKFVSRLVERASGVEATVVEAADQYVARCIACDICPTHIGPDEEYRCIIRGGRRDRMATFHEVVHGQDAVIPVVLSPSDRSGLDSAYQRFIERTRYLRRGDYVLSNTLTAPLVLEEVGVLENMHIRMSTSMLRHHTVLSEPMVAYVHGGEVLNSAAVSETFDRFVDRAALLTTGRLRNFVASDDADSIQYNPVGYVLSTEKEKEDQLLDSRQMAVDRRRDRLREDARRRLEAP